MTQIRQYAAGAVPAKTIDLTYDAAGNLASYGDGTTSALYSYDGNNRKLSETMNYGPSV